MAPSNGTRRVREKLKRIPLNKLRLKNRAITDAEYDDMIAIIQRRGHTVKLKGTKRRNLFQKVRRSAMTVSEDPVTQHLIIKIREYTTFAPGVKMFHKQILLTRMSLCSLNIIKE